MGRDGMVGAGGVSGCVGAPSGLLRARPPSRTRQEADLSAAGQRGTQAPHPPTHPPRSVPDVPLPDFQLCDQKRRWAPVAEVWTALVAGETDGRWILAQGRHGTAV